MAGTSILLVSEKGDGFTINTLETAFKNHNLNPMKAALADEGISTYIRAAEVVMFVDSFENEISLNNVKTLCSELHKKVVLHGDSNVVADMMHFFTGCDVILTLKRPVEAADIARMIIEALKKPEIRKKKILVVDDSGVMLRTMMGWLNGKYEVSLANSAASAASAIERSKPDLILLDYEMPVCSGAEFMESLSMSDDTKDIPIIFLTSRNDAETVNEVMQLKPKGYILKTTPQKEQLKKIDAFFEGH